MAETKLDQARMEAFGGQVLDSINGAGTALFLSIGYRTGLFDAMSQMAPSTSEQIASATSLNERYVREWLNGLVVAGVVEYDPGARTYTLPAEHAALLTRDGRAGQYGVLRPVPGPYRVKSRATSSTRSATAAACRTTDIRGSRACSATRRRGCMTRVSSR